MNGIIINASNADSVRSTSDLCSDDKKLLISLYFEDEEGFEKNGKSMKKRKCKNCCKPYTGNSGNSNYLTHIDSKNDWKMKLIETKTTEGPMDTIVEQISEKARQIIVELKQIKKLIFYQLAIL